MKKVNFKRMGLMALLGLGVVGTFQAKVEASENENWKPRSVQEIKESIGGKDTYEIQWGDYLEAISEATNLTVKSLQNMNNIVDANLIYAGSTMTFNGNTVTVDNGTVKETFEIQESEKVDSSKAVGESVNNNTSADSKQTVDNGSNADKSGSKNDNADKSGSKNDNADKGGSKNDNADKGGSKNDNADKGGSKNDNKKPTNENKYVTINVDESQNVLESTDGYVFVSESTDNGVVEKLANGNTVTTYTTTKVWKKADKPVEPTNENKYVTINVDESQNVLESTDGYVFVSESTDNGVVEKLANGNTVTTYTTTKVWKKADKPVEPTNENKYVTINVDESQNVLESTDGYVFVSESTDNGVVEKLANGNTVTTYTTTKVWKKADVPVEKTWTVYYEADAGLDTSFNLARGQKTFETEEEADAFIDNYADLLLQGKNPNDPTLTIANPITAYKYGSASIM